MIMAILSTWAILKGTGMKSDRLNECEMLADALNCTVWICRCYHGDVSSDRSPSLPKALSSGNTTLANFIRGFGIITSQSPKVLWAKFAVVSPAFCDRSCFQGLNRHRWGPGPWSSAEVSSPRPLWVRIGPIGSRWTSTPSDQLVWRRLEAEITQVEFHLMDFMLGINSNVIFLADTTVLHCSSAVHRHSLLTIHTNTAVLPPLPTHLRLILK